MTDEAAETETPNTSTRPTVKFSGTGALSVAVWKQKSDNGFNNYSIKIDRSYKADDGGFQTTPYLRDTDLLRVSRLLNQADEWIEKEKVRQRSQANDQGR